MDKKIAGLLGAVAAVTTMTGAQAATQTPALQAASYADLLMPVPNATEALIAHDQLLAQSPVAKRSEGVQVAADHHHHHHVVVIKRHRRHHHHHHHHHSGVVIGVPGAGVVVR
jgi:hypothetical protein